MLVFFLRSQKFAIILCEFWFLNFSTRLALPQWVLWAYVYNCESCYMAMKYKANDADTVYDHWQTGFLLFSFRMYIHYISSKLRVFLICLHHTRISSSIRRRRRRRYQQLCCVLCYMCMLMSFVLKLIQT